MGWIEIVILSPVFATLAYVLYQGWRGRHRWGTSGWAEARGLRLTEDNRSFVQTYVRRTRSLRLAGASSVLSRQSSMGCGRGAKFPLSEATGGSW